MLKSIIGKQQKKNLELSIGIVGAGPAGSICAIQLINLSEEKGINIKIDLLDYKNFLEKGPAGCNFCAGVLSHEAIDNLKRIGIKLDNSVIQSKIEGYCLITEGGELNYHQKKKPPLFTIYRGGGPTDIKETNKKSLDSLILEKAIEKGANFIPAMVKSIIIPKDRREKLKIICTDRCFEYDIIVAAFGVNSTFKKDIIIGNSKYKIPKVAKALQVEIPVSKDFLDKKIANKIYVFILDIPRINLAALTPKENYLTLTLIGKDLVVKDFFNFLNNKIVKEKLGLPEETKISCLCYPKLPIKGASYPYGNNFIAIGDANISRYYKDGIGSAYFTATKAAEVIINYKTGEKNFYRNYFLPCRAKYNLDNKYGYLLFKINEMLVKNKKFAKILIEIAEEEAAASDPVIHELLWDMFTGDDSYKNIFWQLFRFRFIHKFIKLFLKEVIR